MTAVSPTLPLRAAALAAVLALLAGCQHRPPTPLAPEPPRQVETGSTFVLNQPLAFAAGSSELLFQNQQIVVPGQVKPGAPLCRLIAAPGAARSLAPGRLAVGPVSYEEREIGATAAMSSPTRIALVPAPGQPGYTMSCGWPPGAGAGGFLTTQQIYDAIGGHFSMDLLR